MTKYLLILTIFLPLLAGCASTEVQHWRSFGGPSMSGEVENKNDESRRLRTMELEDIEIQAKQFLLDGNYGMAQLYYLAAIKRDPDSLPALKGLAMVAYKQNRLEEATQTLEEALELYPEDVEALLTYGEVLRSRGLIEEALIPLAHAEIVEPDNAIVLQELAITHDANGKPREANAYYIRALLLSPRSSSALNNIGFHYLLRGNYLLATEKFFAALRFDPKSPRIRNNLAVSLAMMGDDEGALRLFSQTMGAVEAQNNLGYLHMIKGNLEESKIALEAALNKSPALYVRAMENRAQLLQLVASSQKK
jgi:Flp pilus assembly protein TadD